MRSSFLLWCSGVSKRRIACLKPWQLYAILSVTAELIIPNNLKLIFKISRFPTFPSRAELKQWELLNPGTPDTTWKLRLPNEWNKKLHWCHPQRSPPSLDDCIISALPNLSSHNRTDIPTLQLQRQQEKSAHALFIIWYPAQFDLLMSEAEESGIKL